ncbi:MAG TPA: hypothetical protein PK269_04935 [Bacteroidales bacterium]|nr:hypothetical protein [Bacteroidales bacterium]
MTENATVKKFYDWVEIKSSIKFYPFYLALFLVICSVVFVWPRYDLINTHSVAWNTVIIKSKDLTNSLTYIPSGSWLAKKVFRLTVPVIMKVTHLTPIGIFILQSILGYLLIVFSYKLCYRILKDSVSSTFIAAGIIFLYFGRASFYDFFCCWFDGFAYFFIIMAFFCRNSIGIFLFSTLAAWTDERAFIALSIVFLFHQIIDISKSPIKLKHLIALNNKSLAVIFAMAFYLILRLFLQIKYGMHTPTGGVGLAMLKVTLPVLTFGIWTFLEGFWLLLIVTCFLIIKNKEYVFFVVVLIVLSVFFLVSGCVTDITRSGSYLVPVIFVLMIYLKKNLQPFELRFLLLICLIFSFLSPPCMVCPDWRINDWFPSSTIILFLRYIIDHLNTNNIMH